MTTPALVALRRLCPAARITVLAKPWVEPVFLEHPAVDDVIVMGENGKSGSLTERMHLARALRNQAFDVALLFPNSLDSALTAWLAGIPNRIGYATDGRRMLLTSAIPVPKMKGTRHEVFYYLELVDHVRDLFHIRKIHTSAGNGQPELSLSVPQEGAEGARQMLSELGIGRGARLIGFNPGAAYGPAKCWPSERFGELGRRLLEHDGDSHVLVFGTGEDAETGERICSVIGAQAHNLLGRTTLAEAMGLIARLDLLVTNDSGLMHVGAALDIPLVAIFGSTNPVTTGPWSRKSVVVRHELACAPCLKRTCSTHFECMQGIQVEEVYEACNRQMDRR